MNNLNNIIFTSSDGDVSGSKDGICLIADRTKLCNAEKDSKEDYVFRCDCSVELQEYFVMEYKCTGIRRKLISRAPVIKVYKDGGDSCLVCYDDIVMDSCSHRIAVKVSAGSYDALEIAFTIDRRTKAEFCITNMYTCSYDELPYICSDVMTDSKGAYVPLDISDKFNGKFCDDTEILIDGGKKFDKKEVCLDEIPFVIGCEGDNIICPSAPPAENEDIINNFGMPSKRRLCRPISRDSVIEIPVNDTVSECYFVLTLRGKIHQRWGFATDGPIIGSYCGDVDMPLLADDVERFCVEIQYADGRRDTALPLDIVSKRHGISGMAGVYAVPCDYSLVEKIVFHNRMLDTDCSVMAVTVNNTPCRKYPEMLIPEKTEYIPVKISSDKSVSLEENILTVKNGGLTMVIDVTDGVKLVGMTNEYTPCFKVDEQYILWIDTASKGKECVFDLLEKAVSETGFVLRYKYEFQEIELRGQLDGDSGISWKLNVKNNGDDTVKNSVIFPVIKNVCYNTNEDGWYFFPKYQNIDSNETVYIYEESAPSFPMQFFDIYSKEQQGGLCISTREKGLVVRKYALEKDEKGISAFVEYPSMYGDIPSGGMFEATETVITAHSGDWRKAFSVYTDWLRTWYKPVNCQDKQWYRQCFWLLAEIVDFFETEEFCNLPIWYDKERKEFNFDMILEEQKKIAGCYPDILHLWSWAFKKEGNYYTQQWGNFGTTDYDEYGGVESFRNALQSVRDKGVNVSLYLHPTLLSGRYPQAEKYFPKHRVINSEGEHIVIEGDSYRMCHANEEWRDYAISMYPRIYKELGIPLLYVDEFSLRIENRCYCDHHGHSVPSNLLKTDRDFITALKKAMPEEVVLYGEYYAVDVNASYIDCNISYYIIDSVVDMIETAWRAGDGDDRLGRVFTDVYRFAFPGIVQLILPMAMRNLSWHPQKFLFFNGEAIYDSFWDCEESAGLDFTVKAYKIKKEYSDCFSSYMPQTMIDTMSPAVCANSFPGDNRTIYTLYNRAYSTFRGKGLRIKHTEGNTYYDVWNGCPLEYEVKDGYAELSLCLGAQEIGCVLVNLAKCDE